MISSYVGVRSHNVYSLHQMFSASTPVQLEGVNYSHMPQELMINAELLWKNFSLEFVMPQSFSRNIKDILTFSMFRDQNLGLLLVLYLLGKWVGQR